MIFFKCRNLFYHKVGKAIIISRVILTNEQFDSALNKNYFAFWCTNIIFADCKIVYLEIFSMCVFALFTVGNLKVILIPKV